MILLVLSVCLAAELHQSEGSSDRMDALRTTNLDQQKEIVDEHNKCRRTVEPTAQNMVEMIWDDKLAENAQRWADKCILDHSPGSSRIVGGKQCGENLFMSSTPFSWAYAIEAWCNEKIDFIHGVGASPKDAVVGHYTQVAWATSYKVGCGIAYCPEEPTFKYYDVCQYSPAGNMQGQEMTPYRRGPPCGECPNNCNNGLCTNPCEHDNRYRNCDGLVKKWGCNHPLLREPCVASCNCTTKIR